MKPLLGTDEPGVSRCPNFLFSNITFLDPSVVNQYNPNQFELMVLDYQRQILSTLPEELFLKFLDFNDFILCYPGYEDITLVTIGIAMSLTLAEKLNMISKVYNVKSRLTSICATVWICVLDMLNMWAHNRGDFTLINCKYSFFLLKMQCSNIYCLDQPGYSEILQAVTLAVILKWFEKVRHEGQNYLEHYWGFNITGNNTEQVESMQWKHLGHPQRWISQERGNPEQKLS